MTDTDLVENVRGLLKRHDLPPYRRLSLIYLVMSEIEPTGRRKRRLDPRPLEERKNYSSDYQRKRRDHLIDMGRCPQCSRPNDRAPKRITCSKCAEKASSRRRIQKNLLTAP